MCDKEGSNILFELNYWMTWRSNYAHKSVKFIHENRGCSNSNAAQLTSDTSRLEGDNEEANRTEQSEEETSAKLGS